MSDAPDYDSYLSSKVQHEIERLRAINAELLAALEIAAAKFEQYAGMHRAKNTVDGEQKAAANDWMTKQMRAAIAKAKEARHG